MSCRRCSKAEIRRELDRIVLVTTQLAAVECARDVLIRTDVEEGNNYAALLLELKAWALSSLRSSGIVGSNVGENRR